MDSIEPLIRENESSYSRSPNLKQKNSDEGNHNEAMRETIDERSEGLEIDLQKLIMAYLRKWWLILLCGIVLAAGAWVYTANCITPLYRAEVSVYVNNIRSNQQIDYLSESNLAASQRLVNTYMNIVKSNRVLDKVADELKGDYTTEDLRKMLSSAQVDETEIFKIYISHPSPLEAVRVANLLAEIAPEEISSLIEGSSARVIDYAKTPDQPFTPSYKKNIFLGGMIGCFLAAAYVTLQYLLDVRIKDDEDLAAIAAYPILGQIPVITAAGSSGKKKHGYGYETAPPEEETPESGEGGAE